MWGIRSKGGDVVMLARRLCLVNSIVVSQDYGVLCKGKSSRTRWRGQARQLNMRQGFVISGKTRSEKGNFREEKMDEM